MYVSYLPKNRAYAFSRATNAIPLFRGGRKERREQSSEKSRCESAV